MHCSMSRQVLECASPPAFAARQSAASAFAHGLRRDESVRRRLALWIAPALRKRSRHSGTALSRRGGTGAPTVTPSGRLENVRSSGRFVSDPAPSKPTRLPVLRRSADDAPSPARRRALRYGGQAGRGKG
jgi:hypothetical protein